MAIVSRGRELTYGWCVTRSEALAHGLLSAGLDRFGVALTDPADVLTLLAAASVVGAEPCVYPRELDADRAARLADSFDHATIVSDRPELGVAAEAPLDSLISDAVAPLPDRSRSPVLILTTGTTGEQKGARHDWERLVRSVRRPESHSDARWLLLYNLNQFAGLQVLLHVLVNRCTLVIPDENRVAEAIAAMRAQSVTHVSATPTFWRMLQLTLDRETAAELKLKQITLGGEVAPESLISRLRQLFPNVQLSHVYAGTEFGSAISVNDGHAGLPLSALDRGPDAEIQLRVVDGEIQVRSRVGMLGYHHTEDSEPDWVATGDLVELVAGRILFVGRTSEVINVGGAKVHPLPIEEIVCGLDGVELAAAYGKANSVTGQMVALDVVAAPNVDTDLLKAEIRAACEALPRAGRPRWIRFVPALEMRGNKITRGAAST